VKKEKEEIKEKIVELIGKVLVLQEKRSCSYS
jgi:hypothetical protein